MRVVSKKIRDSARDEDCSFRFTGVCNFNTETIVLCHINTKYKGTGIKSPDIFAAYGCSDCHRHLDSGATHDYRGVLNALVETQYKLLNKGLITASS